MLFYAATGARVVLAGVKGFKPVPDFISDTIVVKELTLTGVLGVTSRGYRAAIRLIESGTVPLAELHTHHFGLEQAEYALQLLGGEIESESSVHSCLLPA